MVYELNVLGIFEKGEKEDDIDFARRCQIEISNSLKIKATNFTNKDALKFRQSLLENPQKRKTIFKLKKE